MACPSPASACAYTQPPPAPIPPAPESCASARAREPDGCDARSDAVTDQLWLQLAPCVPAHFAPASAYSAFAATWTELAHRPFAPAVQSERPVAVLCPPDHATWASPAT